MDLKEIGWDSVELIYLAQDGLVNSATNRIFVLCKMWGVS